MVEIERLGKSGLFEERSRASAANCVSENALGKRAFSGWGGRLGGQTHFGFQGGQFIIHAGACFEGFELIVERLHF